LGGDSILEASKFDFKEFVFWVTTLPDVFRPDLTESFKLMVLYSILSILSFFIYFFVFGFGGPRLKLLSVFAISSSVFLVFFTSAFFFYDNSSSFDLVTKNFSNESPLIAGGGRNINVLVYIGESTTNMNMGVYGYPRNTTPRLSDLYDKGSNIILFDNVYSTHTHTSQSLLEALSFPVDKDENYLPIVERRRISIVEVLRESGLEPLLISNQGSTGTWNQAASVVFRNSRNLFSGDTRMSGNADFKLKKPLDHEFFDGTSGLIKAAMLEGRSISFFHSYAGHGEYKSFIPQEFRSPVDDLFVGLKAASVVGNSYASIDRIDTYDSAVKYIDYSINNAIDFLGGGEEPAVFIYFSDHGESVYTGGGHDSARMYHEMLRVPFIMYFNQSAKTEYPELYRKYLRLSQGKSLSTLAQLPSTILDILGIYFLDPKVSESMLMPVVGEEAFHYPIAVRETARGIEYSNLNSNPINISSVSGVELIDSTNVSTRIHVETLARAGEDSRLCYHRSNTLGKSLRGLLVSECLEIDLVVSPSGELDIRHPPVDETNFMMGDLLKLQGANPLSLWIDSKNLLDRNSCFYLYDFISENFSSEGEVLIEFPSGSYSMGDELLDCTKKLISNGYNVSYYVPTDEAIACSSAIKEGVAFEKDEDCADLALDIKRALASGLYSDLSFDYLGVDAVSEVNDAGRFRWNTWNVRPEEVGDISSYNFGMVILRNDDPNNI